jgi:hypothetical protein
MDLDEREPIEVSPAEHGDSPRVGKREVPRIALVDPIRADGHQGPDSKFGGPCSGAKERELS